MDVERIAPPGPRDQLLALQRELRGTGDIGDIIPEEARRVQDGDTRSSFDESLMETVALALVQADLVASEDVSEGERFDSTKEALDKAGVPMAQFLQMSETKAFQDIYDRYTRLFFVQLRKGRVLKAASSSAMNGSVAAMKLVMDHKDEEPDAVRQKLEEIEAGGDRAFHGAILEIQDKLRRLSERVEVRRATDEQINAARATASERRVEERSAAKVDYRKLLCEKDLLP